LEKLGTVIKSYAPNFYGTDYSTSHEQKGKIGLDSDRLFAEWHLNDEKVVAFSKGEEFIENADVAATIEISNDWNDLVKDNPEKAIFEQQRVKNEFQKAFADNLICTSFHRDDEKPNYLLYVNKSNNF
jgi:predicted GNAT superfamily acetyltransferase